MVATQASGRDQTRGGAAPPGRGLPRVSVVVPTHNYARFLPACVESALRQPNVDVDVLIIDDASTDDTDVVTDALAASDPRVRVIRHGRNRGHIHSFNEGLFGIDGTYVVKLDADDLLPPGALARATDLLEDRPDVGFVTGRPVHFTGEPPRPGSPRVRGWTVWSGHDWVADRCRRGCNSISNPEVVMRTAVMRAAGGQKADVPHTSDFELWLQMAALADVGRVNGPPQGYYRVHDQSMQRTVHAGVLTDLRGLRDAYASAFAGAAGTLPDAAELHRLARRRLAEKALDLACRALDRGRTDELPVDELVAFALEVWPAACDLPLWRALDRRLRVGAARAAGRPQFVARAVVRRASEEVNRWHWQRTGHR